MILIGQKFFQSAPTLMDCLLNFDCKYSLVLRVKIDNKKYIKKCIFEKIIPLFLRFFLLFYNLLFSSHYILSFILT